MKKIIELCGVSLLITTLLPGCCMTGSQSNNSRGSITLEDAMASIGRGFYQMKTNEQGVSTGLLPDTVTVTLNVGVSHSDYSTESSGLTVSAPIATGLNMGANVSGSHSSSQTSQTANTITITFKNILFAGVTTTTASDTNKPPASSSNVLPLLKDPETAIQMLTWINTNKVGSYHTPGTNLTQAQQAPTDIPSSGVMSHY